MSARRFLLYLAEVPAWAWLLVVSTVKFALVWLFFAIVVPPSALVSLVVACFKVGDADRSLVQRALNGIDAVTDPIGSAAWAPLERLWQARAGP